MSMYHAQKKHRANHGNYYDKPTKKDVNALLGMYEGIANAVVSTPKPKAKKGEQLKLNL